MRLLRIFGLLAFCSTLLPLSAVAMEEAPTLTHARIADVQDGAPPSESAKWTDVDLPHQFGGRLVPDPISRWFRFTIDRGEASRDGYAVMIGDVAMNAEVFWNGTKLGDGGSLEPPIAQNFHHPLYFAVPLDLVAARGNVLDVRVVAAPHFKAWLGGVRVGPVAAVRPIFEREAFWRQSVPQASTLIGFIVSALMGLFWIGSRQAFYGWFSFAILCYSIGNLNMHMTEIPIPTNAWVKLICFCINVSAVLFLLHVLDLIGERSLALERFAIGWCVLLALLLIPVSGAWLVPVANSLYALHFCWAAYALTRAAHAWRSLPRMDFALMTLTGSVLVGITAHDLVVLLSSRGAEPPRFYYPLTTPTFIVAFAFMLTLRFVRTFRLAEKSNEELEHRVEEKHRELEANFAKLRRLEDERILTSERERMMREVHDGLGGRLVETLSLVESRDATLEEVAGSIRASLDEMRLLIDSLDPLIDDLPALLGTLRGRLEPTLRRSDIVLEWGVEEIPPLARLGPRDFVHVLRIVQESLTNVVKHAKASRVAVRARAQEGDGQPKGVWIEIEDDGCGAGSNPREGRGLGNIRKRSQALDGEVRIQSTDAGTRVSLWLPESP